MKQQFFILNQNIFEGTFYIDEVKEEQYKGYTMGYDWNGWENPLFDFTTCKKLCANWNNWGWMSCNYDKKNDTFIIENTAQEVINIIESEEYIINGVPTKLYNFGNEYTWNLLD